MANIQFKDIRKSYGDVAVVHGISLDIRDGAVSYTHLTLPTT